MNLAVHLRALRKRQQWTRLLQGGSDPLPGVIFACTYKELIAYLVFLSIVVCSSVGLGEVEECRESPHI